MRSKAKLKSIWTTTYSLSQSRAACLALTMSNMLHKFSVLYDRHTDASKNTPSVFIKAHRREETKRSQTLNRTGVIEIDLNPESKKDMAPLGICTKLAQHHWVGKSPARNNLRNTMLSLGTSTEASSLKTNEKILSNQLHQDQVQKATVWLHGT